MRIIAPRWKKVIRDIGGNKSRSALVVMSIAVGIVAIGVTSGSRGTVARVLNASYQATNPASGEVMIGDDGFGDSFVETVKGMREVELAEGRKRLNLRYKVNPTDQWKQIELTAAANFKDSKIAKVWPEKGQWPPPDKKLVIERSSLEKLGLKIGDSMTVEDSNKKLRTMQIVGTAHDLGGMPAGLSNGAAGFISRNTLQWLGEDTRDFNQMLYIVAEGKMDEAHIEAVGKEIQKKFETQGIDSFGVMVPTPGEHPVNSVMEPLLLILTGLGVLSLVLSGFLVVNTISAMLTQQKRQIGIMKAIGGRRGQIMGLYFVTVFIYGLCALALALPLGTLGAMGLTTFLLNFFNTDLDSFSVPTSVLAIQIAIGLLVPVLTAIYPILSGTRITVREAVSDYGVGKGEPGTGVVDRLLGRFRGVSRPMLISLRNTFRRKGRLALTLLTLTLAGTTFISIFSIRASLLTTLTDMMESFGFDAMVLFKKEYRMEQIERAVAYIPGIKAAENWGRATVNRVYADGNEGDDVTMNGLPADSQMYQPDVLSGRWIRSDDTNALAVTTDFLDDEPDLKLGDQVILDLNSKDTTWNIVGIVQGTMESEVYSSQPYFNRLTHNVNKARMVNFAFVNPDQLRSPMAMQSLEQQFANAGLEVQFIMTLAEIQAMMQTTFNFLVTFLLSMAVVLAAVGGLGLSGTMSMNVLERVREIGVMRALGASDGAVLRLVLVEGVIIGLLSWVAAAIVALPLSYVLSNVLGQSLLSRPLTFEYSLTGLMVWAIVAAVLAVIASFFPARGASRLTVREVLAYE